MNSKLKSELATLEPTRSGKQPPQEPPEMSSYGKEMKKLMEIRQKKNDLLKKMSRSR